MTVLPVDVTYAISRPARSTGPAPTFVISANSSDAELPPVWISDTRSVEGGQVTAAVTAAPGSLAAAHAAPPAASTTQSAARTARRVRSTDRPPGRVAAQPDGTARALIAAVDCAPLIRADHRSRGSPADHRRITCGISRDCPRRVAFDARVRPAPRQHQSSKEASVGPRQADRSLRGPAPIPPVDRAHRRRRRGRRSSSRRRRARAPDSQGRARAPRGQPSAERPGRVRCRVPPRVPPAEHPRGPPDAPDARSGAAASSPPS